MTDSDTTNGADGDVLGARGGDDANPASKDPSEWVTGDEPMTASQRSYLDTLAREAGEELPADLTKALSLPGSKADTLAERAKTHLAADQYDAALADVDAAIADQDNVPDYYALRAKVQEKRGRRDDAIGDFKKTLELDPASKVAKGGLYRLGATP